MTACEDKVVYLSEYLARNAATLHTFVHPDCHDVQAYRCPQCKAWHIGHQHRDRGEACKAAAAPRPPNTFSKTPKTKKPRPRGNSGRSEGAA